MTEEKKTILLITGMHRSGTSLLGSIVESFGIPLPGKLIKGDIYNKDGYFENSEIVDIQERLLIEMGRWWPTTYGCNPMPNNWENTNIVMSYKEKLRSLISMMVENKGEISAIKDPRASLLIPLWKNICNEQSIELKIITSVRDPGEVINSLMNRDKETTGMSEERAEKLWNRHNSELIYGMNLNKSMLIDYSKWFNQRQCTEQLRKLYEFCLLNDLSKEIEQKAIKKIVYGYRRSNKDQKRIKRVLTSKTKRFYNKLIKATDIIWEKGEENEIAEWLTYVDKKEREEEIDKKWFNKHYYITQIKRNLYSVSARMHYNIIGWRDTLSPNILFNPNHYKHKAYIIGEDVKHCPLSHFSQYGFAMNIEPNAFTNYKWLKNSLKRVELFKSANIEGFHPWAAAAVAVNSGSQINGIKTLQQWIDKGLQIEDIELILNSPIKYYNQKILSTIEKEEELPYNINVICDNCNEYNWQMYPWLDIIYQGREYLIDSNSVNDLYLILSSHNELNTEMFLNLSTSPWVYCVTEKTWELLHKLGINAKKVDQSNISQSVKYNNKWKTNAANFGFPDPKDLASLTNLLVLGEIEDEITNCEMVNCLPNPNKINIMRTDDAQSISRWLVECYLQGLQLAWITNNRIDINSKFWKAFQMIGSRHEHLYSPELFIYPVGSEELLSEIEWRKNGFKRNIIVNPEEYEIRKETTIYSDIHAEISVCVSLYNYESKIINALESVKSQSLQNIDLIIVDDCSTDKGLKKVTNWLTNNSTRFNKVKVVSHPKNLGLSTARNTAFELAETEWIFVLDADNIILPLALETMLTLTTRINEKVAAIYPLIRAVNEGTIQTKRPNSLMNFNYWDQSKFAERNIIDAMALIKKSIWIQVGGYDNIIGGWEDYDFWCKIIENGYYGLICPQILAEYNIHENSMITRKTSRSSRKISRQLQEKHGWLSLPMANEHKIMMEK